MKGLKRVGRRVLLLAGASFVAGGLATSGYAQIYTLNDNNSVATVNVGNTGTLGMQSWQVDPTSYLSQQWFWYRTTDSGAAHPINTISAAAVNAPYGVNGRALSVTYSVPTYNIRVDYLLSGGAPLSSGVSDIGETITINNTGNSTLTFQLFQYSDFNLNAGGVNDTVELGKNLRGLYNEAYQSSPTPNVKLTETVVTPGANHGEAALINNTLAEITSPTFGHLNDQMGPISGDVTWAFEWDLSIAAGSSAVISKDKYLSVGPVPEPAALSLLSLGLVAYALRKRK
jgi:hypothetical protein